MINDLNAYKKAKTIVKETNEVLAIVKDSYKRLSKYRRYLPVREVLNELITCEAMLSMLRAKQKEIVANKGQLDNGIDR